MIARLLILSEISSNQQIKTDRNGLKRTNYDEHSGKSNSSLRITVLFNNE